MFISQKAIPLTSEERGHQHWSTGTWLHWTHCLLLPAEASLDRQLNPSIALQSHHISLVAEGQTTAHGATANPEHTVWHSSSSATSMAHRLPKALKSHLDRRYELWEACELKSVLVLTNEQSPIWTLGKGQETFTAPKCPVVQPTHGSCAGLKAGIVTLVTLLI